MCLLYILTTAFFSVNNFYIACWVSCVGFEAYIYIYRPLTLYAYRNIYRYIYGPLTLYAILQIGTYMHIYIYGPYIPNTNIIKSIHICHIYMCVYISCTQIELALIFYAVNIQMHVYIISLLPRIRRVALNSMQ